MDITLKKDNSIKIVSSEQEAAIYLQRDYEIIVRNDVDISADETAAKKPYRKSTVKKEPEVDPSKDNAGGQGKTEQKSDEQTASPLNSGK